MADPRMSDDEQARKGIALVGLCFLIGFVIVAVSVWEQVR